MAQTLTVNEIISERDGSNYENINNTLKVFNTDQQSSSNHTNAKISLKVKNTSGTGEFKDIYIKKNNSIYDLYLGDDNNQFLTTENIETDIPTKDLQVANMAVGTSDSTTSYINFLKTGSTNTGNDGYGFKNNNGVIQFRNTSGSTTDWTDLSGLTVSLADLTDTTITSIGNNQLLVYNSSSSKWVNQTNLTLPGTLTLGGNLTVSSNFIKVNDYSAITDSVGNEVLSFVGNTASKNNVNYLIL